MVLKDLPDHTIMIIHRYEGGFIGLEELAARLGAVPPWNMQGNLVFAEDFEAELTDWHDEGTPAGLAVRSSRHKFSGSWSVKITANISESTTYGVLRHYFHYPGDGKYNLFLRLGWDTDLQYFSVAFDIYTGTRRLQLELAYNQATGEAAVLTTGGAYTVIATDLYLGVAEVVFFPILFAFDTENEVYGTLYFGGHEYDLSSVPVQAAASTARPQCTLDVYPYGETGEVTVNIYLDCVALTENVQ